MLRGHCLCGAVRFEVDRAASPVGHCHCSKCRRVSGTGACAIFWVGGEDLRFTAGQEGIRRFAFPDGWGTCFCGTCGSPLPRRSADGKTYYVPAGLLDGPSGLQAAVHIHVDSKADWEQIHGPLPQFRAGLGSERADEG